MPKAFEKMKFAIHSKCCGAHWELVITEKGTWDLWCEKCLTPVSSGVKITGPDPAGLKCTCCEPLKPKTSDGESPYQ